MREVSPSSDYCQRWTEGVHTWRHRHEGGFDASRYEVHEIPEAVAKAYVVAHHYSTAYPAAARRYGLFEIPESRFPNLVGVCVLGIPVQKAVLTHPFPDLEAYVESLELSRLVLADAVAGNGESWFLGRVFEMAAAAGVRGIVSFADPQPRTVAGRLLFPGHVGTIYQATNAVYAGRATARTLTLLPTGEVLNARSAQKVRSQQRGHEHVEAKLCSLGATPMAAEDEPARWLAHALVQLGVTRIRHNGNHRYLFRLGVTRRQRQAVRLGLPGGAYPKVRDAA